VAWVRRLTPAVGTTTQAFATVLGSYLLALALGSLLLGPRRGSGPTRGPLVVLGLAALPAALLPAAVEPVARWAGGAASGAETLLDHLLVRAVAAALVVVPSALVGAAALPWLVRATAPRAEEAGRGAGRLLLLNTAGSAVGAVLTAALWFPAVGSAAVLRGAGGLYLAGAALLAGGLLRPALALAAAALLVEPLVLGLPDAAGRDAVGATFMPERFPPDDAPALFHEEGRVSTVVVRDREGRREFWVEGKIEASAQPEDRLHLTLLGALPMSLHPRARRVALIGLGSGVTARAVAAFEPETLVVYELEPAVLRASRFFEAEGGGLPPSARFVEGDGRRGLAADPAVYDVITSDPIHPGVAGSAALYSLEHYRLARARLAEGGLFCQWLPLYQLDREDVRLALRTFARGFEHPWVFQAGQDLVLVGSREPLVVGEEDLRRRLEGAGGATLAPLGLRSPGRLLGLVLKDPGGVRRFAGDGPVNEDDRLLLEFRAGRHAHLDETGSNARLLGIGRAAPASLLAAPPGPRFAAELEGAALHDEAVRGWLSGDVARAVEAFSALADADPEDRFSARMRDDGRIALARERAREGDAPEALAIARAVLDGGGLDPGQRLDVAEVLRDAGEAAEARALAGDVLREGSWPRALRLSR
jgi:spermidine synthase